MKYSISKHPNRLRCVIGIEDDLLTPYQDLRERFDEITSGLPVRVWVTTENNLLDQFRSVIVR